MKHSTYPTNVNSIQPGTSFRLKALSILLLAAMAIGCKDQKGDDTSNSSSSEVARQAAEYEPQEAIWLLWPPADHTKELSNESVSLQLVKAIAPEQKVVITASNDSVYQRAREALGDTLLDHPNTELLKIASEEIWVRDMGPVFVELKNGERAIVDFKFNAWGYGDDQDPYTKRMEAYDREVAGLKGLKVIESNLISEGGNREVNSQGVLMLTETVTMGRNPNLGKPAIEEEFKRVLGAKKIIWLKQGLLEDQHSFLGPITTAEGDKAYTVITTNGHIDEYARFVNDSTILLADVAPEDLDDPIGLENKKRMEQNLKILKEARNLENKPFKIIRLPLPKPVIKTMYPGDPVYDYLAELDYVEGTVFPTGDPVKVIAAASYLNFIITNKLVIAQKYGSDDPKDPNHLRDEQALEILQGLFPDRKIIQIDALSVNLGGGGLHCISMQEPSTSNTL